MNKEQILRRHLDRGATISFDSVEGHTVIYLDGAALWIECGGRQDSCPYDSRIFNATVVQMAEMNYYVDYTGPVNESIQALFL